MKKFEDLMSISNDIENITAEEAKQKLDDPNVQFIDVRDKDSFTKEINYNEVIVDFDGTRTTTSQTYIDTSLGLSNSSVGIITAKFENNLIVMDNAGSHRNIYIGHPEFEGFTVVLWNFEK